MNRPTKFSDNLKYYRKKQGLTQSGLAQMIGYTEKSVSKWENGNALPPMDMCVRLAELFKISLDELMFEKTTRHYFLGIDGGGTKTVFKLTDDKGGVIDCIYKGSSNPNDIGMEKATE
ncbi:MAG: XRE family transcriptional regulator, partial [Clostridia bacterium]|nr:XRE family transcriptional regulator [Clostridia bacterium]